MCKALVHRYKAMLIEKDLAPATINLRLAAVRRLAQEAADNGLLDASVASSISKVHGLRLYGVRIGIWLTSAGARELLGIPDSGSVRGKRDRAILAVLLGCGLRRSETAAVSIAQFRIVEDRWVIADLVGKHGRIRTVPVPIWAKAAVDEWCRVGSIIERDDCFDRSQSVPQLQEKALADRPSTNCSRTCPKGGPRCAAARPQEKLCAFSLRRSCTDRTAFYDARACEHCHNGAIRCRQAAFSSGTMRPAGSRHLKPRLILAGALVGLSQRFLFASDPGLEQSRHAPRSRPPFRPPLQEL